MSGVDGVREEVAAGEAGDRFLLASRRAARRCSAGRPTPTGGYDWTSEDIDDLVFDTVARVTPQRLVLAASQAASDAQFLRWLQKACRTTLELRARGTASGRVLRAIDAALGEDAARFVHEHETGCWALTGDERAPHPDVCAPGLVEAAWAVPTALPAQAVVLGSRADVREVAAAVLGRSGPLPTSALGEVLAHRFNVAFSEYVEYFGAHEGDEDDPAGAPTVGSPESTLVAGDTARWFAQQLTEGEADLLLSRLGGKDMRTLAKEGGVTKYRIEVLTARLDAKLGRLAAAVGPDSADVVDRVRDILGQREPPGDSNEQDDGGAHGT